MSGSPLLHSSSKLRANILNFGFWSSLTISVLCTRTPETSSTARQKLLATHNPVLLSVSPGLNRTNSGGYANRVHSCYLQSWPSWPQIPPLRPSHQEPSLAEGLVCAQISVRLLHLHFLKRCRLVESLQLPKCLEGPHITYDRSTNSSRMQHR